ncbi:23S rRNA (uracil(1939)-C(5))-methyltransferase RlmD [Microbulbifer celer]|uniref:23S rRNA (uracil(1939)-C(5))-methyltransferase RlmD n=1 Tax=Microbulbifer celer TaxID=435905 RepID=A0ABW3U4A6_9GAMM|nr:23S rRNA (uracil(1939)-C(5))-methyltransferase RlmD [Microbulbifer celer]UFN57660.1 23S rRNA (uracil(1939)-C(5))-methyltransferase RlmD [Microbulbifer celer]
MIRKPGRRPGPPRRPGLARSQSTQRTTQSPVVQIDKLSHEVRGIARYPVDGKNKTLFVDNALPGEEVKVKITASRARFDEGIASEIIQPSADRRTPPCPHFEHCGGCAIQYMDPAAQIAAKQQILLDQLQRFAHATPEQVLPPLTGDNFGYRRRARLGVRFVKQAGSRKPQLVLGFREKRSNNLVDITECGVLPADFSAQIPALHQLVDSCTGRKQISHIEVAIGDDATALVVRHLQPLSEEDRQRLLDYVKTRDYHLYLQDDSGASTVWPEQGAERLAYGLADFGLTLQFHPQDFIQVNFDINRQMVSRAIELLDPQADERVLDLFCGLGNFTLPLATRAAEVVGVEGAKVLTERGRENAAHNNLDNIHFQAADLTADFTRSPWARGGFDKILLDPPRTGALEVVRNIATFGARRIVYVSCNPATLARDTAELIQRGYRLSKAGVMDMFPHTTHVESIALFEKT